MSNFTNLMPEEDFVPRFPTKEDYPLLDYFGSDEFLENPGKNAKMGEISLLEYKLLESFLKRNISKFFYSDLTTPLFKFDEILFERQLQEFERTLCQEIKKYLLIFNYNQVINYLQHKTNHKYILNVLKNTRLPNPCGPRGCGPSTPSDPDPVIAGGLTGGTIEWPSVADRLRESPAINRPENEPSEWGYVLVQGSLTYDDAYTSGKLSLPEYGKQLENGDLEKVFYENQASFGITIDQIGYQRYKFLQSFFNRQYTLGNLFNVKNYRNIIETLEKTYVSIPCPRGPLTPRSSISQAAKQILIALKPEPPQPMKLPDLRPI